MTKLATEILNFKNQILAFTGILCFSSTSLGAPVRNRPVKVHQTFNCQSEPALRAIEAPEYLHWRFFQKKVSRYVVNPYSHCLKVKTEVLLSDRGQKKKYAQAEILEIRLVDANELRFSEKYSLAAKYALAQKVHGLELSKAVGGESAINPTSDSKTNSRQDSKFQKLAIIKVKPKQIFWAAKSLYRNLVPKDIPFAKTLTPAQFQGMKLSQSPVFFANLTQKKYLTDSKNSLEEIFQFDARKNHWILYKPKRARRHRKVSNYDKYLPKDKKKAFIVVGDQNKSTRHLRLIEKLYDDDYTNLFFHLIPDTDDELRSQITLAGSQVHQKKLDGALLIDVRKRIKNRKKIIGSEHRDLSNKEEFISSLPKNKYFEIVFFGQGKNSQRALLAAKLAKKHGWVNVYVFDGGVNEWKFYADLFPRRFKLQK